MQQEAVFDVLSEEFANDRHSVFRRFSASNPISQQPITASLSGRKFTSWDFFRYDGVQFVLKDSRFKHEIRKILAEALPPWPEPFRALMETQNNWMLLKDPPDHTRLRSLVSQAFTPRIVEKMAPHIENISKYLLQGIAGDMEIVSEYAFPLPVIVIAELLGVPAEDRDLFKEWSNVLIQTLDYNGDTIHEVYARGSQVVVELRDYFRALVREREGNPREDLISGMVAARTEGAKLSEEELLDTCILLLSAGHETTVNLISNSLLLLMQHPGELHKLRTNPELLPMAVEESLRFESPVQLTSRFASEDVEVQGHVVKKGDVVHLWLASANRDEDYFQNAHSFDITRQPNRHLAFSTGAHFCLGAPLARLEGQIAIKSFLEEFTSFEMMLENAVWKRSVLMRSQAELPVCAERESLHISKGGF